MSNKTIARAALCSFAALGPLTLRAPAQAEERVTFFTANIQGNASSTGSACTTAATPR